MRNYVGALAQKVSTLTVALVLLFSSIAAGVPLFLSQIANAAPSTTYTSSGFSSHAWAQDRTSPSGGYTVSGNALTLNVDNTNASASAGFYRTEGVQTTFASPVTSVKATLYVDSDWATKPVRAGVWGSGGGWPIIEYVNGISTSPGHTGWRIWDTNDPGGWVALPSTVATNTSYTLEIAVNIYTGNYEYYVDSSLVGTLPLPASTKALTGVIFNNFNSALTAADNYTVSWSDFQTGVRTPEAPTGLKFFRGVTEVPAGSTVNYADITLKWDTVPNTERYQIRVTDPTLTSQANRYTGWYTFDLDDTTRHGHFGTLEGTWQYEIRTKDATTGAWSAYTAPVTLKYDNTAPTVLVKANDAALPENTHTDPALFIAGAAPTTFQVTLTDSVSGPYGAYIELFKANYDGTYGNWVKDNTSGTGNVRYGANPKLVYDTSSLTGRYGLKIVSRDIVGNSVTTYHFFTVDSTFPVITFTGDTPADGAYIRGTVPVNAVITDTNIGPYNLRIENPSPAPLSLGLFYVFSPISGATNTYSWNTLTGDKAVSDGAHKLTATTVDKAGNRSTITRTVTVDNTAPTVPEITAPLAGNYFNGNSTLNAWTSSTDATSGIAGYEVKYEFDGLSTAYRTTTGTSRTQTFSGNYQGPITISVRAKDAAGNWSAYGTPVTYYYDSIAPAVAIATPSDTAVVGGDATVAITANIDDAVSYTILIDGTAVLTDEPAPFTAYNWDTTGLASGIYTIRVEAKDTAGNVGVDEITVTVDNTGATSTVVIPTGIVENTGTFAISGEASEPLTSVLVTINGTPYTATITGGSSWTTGTITNTLAAGSYAVVVTLIDAAGNTSTETGSLVIVAVPPTNPGATVLPTFTPTGGTVAGATTTSDVTGNVSESDGEVLAATTADGDKVEGTVEEGNANSGFNWWWILPILAAFFFIILAVRRRKDKDEA